MAWVLIYILTLITVIDSYSDYEDVKIPMYGSEFEDTKDEDNKDKSIETHLDYKSDDVLDNAPDYEKMSMRSKPFVREPYGHNLDYDHTIMNNYKSDRYKKRLRIESNKNDYDVDGDEEFARRRHYNSQNRNGAGYNKDPYKNINPVKNVRKIPYERDFSRHDIDDNDYGVRVKSTNKVKEFYSNIKSTDKIMRRKPYLTTVRYSTRGNFDDEYEYTSKKQRKVPVTSTHKYGEDEHKRKPYHKKYDDYTDYYDMKRVLNANQNTRKVNVRAVNNPYDNIKTKRRKKDDTRLNLDFSRFTKRALVDPRSTRLYPTLSSSVSSTTRYVTRSTPRIEVTTYNYNKTTETINIDYTNFTKDNDDTDQYTDVKGITDNDITGKYTNDDDITGKYTNDKDITGKYTNDDDITGKYTNDRDITGKYTNDDTTGKYTTVKDITGKYTNDDDITGKYTNNKDITDKYTNDDDITGKNTNDRDITGKYTNADDITGKYTDDQDITDKYTTAKYTNDKDITGKYTNVKDITGKYTNDKDLTGKYTNNKDITGKYTNYDDITGKNTNDRDVTGKYTNADDITSKYTDDQDITDKYTTAKYTNDKDITGKYTNEKDITGKYTNDKDLTGKYTNRKDITDKYTNGNDITDKYTKRKDVTDKYTKRKDVTDKYSKRKEVTDKYTKRKDNTDKYTNGKDVTDKYTNGKVITDKYTSGKEVTDKYTNVQDITDKYTNGQDITDKYTNGKDKTDKYTDYTKDRTSTPLILTNITTRRHTENISTTSYLDETTSDSRHLTTFEPCDLPPEHCPETIAKVKSILRDYLIWTTKNSSDLYLNYYEKICAEFDLDTVLDTVIDTSTNKSYNNYCTSLIILLNVMVLNI